MTPSTIEQIPELKIGMLVDSKTGKRVLFEDKEIRVTRKSYIMRKSETRSKARSSITAEDIASRLGSRRDSIS